MATYAEIQERVRHTDKYVPKTCWIADVKSAHGLTTRSAPNRQSQDHRTNPCPSDKQLSIENALKHFGMIK